LEKLKIGVVSRSFGNLTHAETAVLMREKSVTSTELCLHSADTHYFAYNGRSDISDMTDKRFAEIAALYRAEGVELTSVGVFTNCMHPDKNESDKNMDFFERHMQWAGQNGIPYVATECGFTGGQRGVNADRYETDFARLADNLADLCRRAEKYNVGVALECCVLDVVPSAKRAAGLKKQIGSDRFKFLLDPANFIANSSEIDMFDYLAGDIAYFHGKDRKLNDAYGRLLGDGDIDWPLFLRLYHERCEGIPFILEYVNQDNFKEIMDRTWEYDEAARRA